MAKTISDEKMKLSIIIDGNPAQKELFDLEKATRKLNEENKALGLQKKLLIKQGKEETDEFKNLTDAIKANNKELATNKTKMKELQDQIGLTGLTMHQLTERARLLRLQLNNAIPGGEAHRRYSAELEQVNNRLSELRGNSNTARTSLGTLADTFNRYQGIALSVVAALTGIVISIQEIIAMNSKLSDAQSNVMKTTGMTKVEVDELTKSFGLLQTRTSRIDLLGIAEQGGRIGIAKAEIGDFVNVMNKASVSLGDSFTGGAEEVANKLGKIKFLFQETKDIGVEQAYNAIGSAINDLGANGTASEANIADFTTRIGSLTDVLKPTIQQTLALGTAFEESGIESEVSARAYGIFMKQASTESGKFAKVMGISQKAVENMINTDPLEFMLKFSEGMKGMDATKTAKTLDYLGISADGANKVIGAMGNNTARFRELMMLSNKSFADGTSLVNEYDIKNNNLAATLEKISKTVSGWFSSETFIKWLTIGVDWLAKFIGATEDADGKISAWKNTLIFTAKIIGIVTAAIMTNVAWQKLVALWTTRNTEANLLYTAGEKAKAFITGVSTIATQAQAVAVAWATGNTIAMKEAQTALGLAMKTTPWGFIISAIAAVVVAYQMFSKQVDIAANVQKTLADVQLETVQAINKEKNELEALTKIAQDETLSKEKRLEAIKKLNEIIPDYIGTLTLENIKNAEGTDILKKYTEEIYKNARAKSVAKKYQELSDQKLAVEEKSLNNYQSGTNKFFNGKVPDNLKNEKDIWRQAYELTQKQINKEGQKFEEGTVEFYRQTKFNEANITAKLANLLTSKNEELANIDAQMKSLEPEVLKNKINDLGKTNPDSSVSNYNIPGGKEDKTTAPKKYDDSYINDELKLREDLYNIRKKSEEARISLMQDGYEKDLALEKLNTDSKIQELNLQNEAIKNLDKKLDKDLITAKKAGDSKKIASIENQKKLLLQKQQGNNDLICYEEEMQKLRLATIEEKGAKDQIQKEKEAFDLAKTLRQIKYNEELTALGDNEIAKENLRKDFEDKESIEQEKYLKKLINDFNTIIGKGKFEQMDMSLLTPEQVQEFTKLAAEAGLSLAQLLGLRNKLTGNSGPSMTQALGLKGETDIFGFTQDNWTQFYENLKTGTIGVESMVFAVQALTNVWSQYGAFLEANENASLQKFERTSDAKKTKFKRQLDSGIISQKTYTKLTEKIDKDLDKKKAEIAYNQAKRERIIAISNAITGTAVAVIGALGNKPWTPLNFALAGLVGVMGALQLGSIMKTPLPAKGYESGLYGDYVKREQDGKVFKSRYGGKTRSGLVSDTSHFLVAENGPEMVIDNKAWRQMNPEVKDSLIRELNGIKGFEKGLYNQESKRYEVPAATNTATSTSSNQDSQFLQMAINVISENTAVMKDLRDNGVFVTNKDLKSMKNLKEGIDAFNELRTKSKR